MIKALCIIIGTLSPAKECAKNLEMKKNQTSIEVSELKEVLQESHIEVFGTKANVNKINMAWAQIALENGKGKLVYNYNLGNIGAHATKNTKPFYRVAGSKFISFLSFKQGAKTYWKVLKNRCPGSLSYFSSGDVKSAATMLKNCNYYESDLDSYYFSMNSLYKESFKY
jgi:hypothetical protein